MHSKKLVILASLATVALLAFSALADGLSQPLFFIQRSKNANEVHYDARLQKDGSLDPSDPVDGYWLNKAEDGSRSGITLLQRIAYGYDTQSTGNGTYALKLKAFNERAMWIVKSHGRWRVQTTIAGKQAFMDRLYVATDESGVFPKVRYVDVFGVDMTTGKPIQEHITK